MHQRRLSEREYTIADLVARGMTNPEIAITLGISRSTVKSSLTNIMNKWDCANRTQVGVAAARRHLH